VVVCLQFGSVSRILPGRRDSYTILIHDRLLSVKSGNPITIHDEDIGITWPGAVVSCV
jgi:hypothetical protein